MFVQCMKNCKFSKAELYTCIQCLTSCKFSIADKFKTFSCKYALFFKIKVCIVSTTKIEYRRSAWKLQIFRGESAQRQKVSSRRGGRWICFLYRWPNHLPYSDNDDHHLVFSHEIHSILKSSLAWRFTNRSADGWMESDIKQKGSLFVLD